ncbi:DUF6691 family protein [Aliiroseovarius subalbicans]|uniref:DUF6691 family protein n=1 Tax=Aliiroseovarius subalbicans TaxID=2925840 RepID=UPI001F58043E|nr:DUF6691 family protein [Aliiroseovarius subalbicans]MCI2398125.1 YeeE/YedE family protein [Aliiroseovarius subalbicans]
MQLIFIYAAGLIFGLGISMSGMGNPAKVINFFDVFGPWDPSLAFVMGGAVIVTFFGYRAVLKQPKPMFEPTFSVPTSKVIDARLVGGSALFGVGWGISGFCPGASIPMLGSGNSSVLIFTASLIAGIFAARWMMAVTQKRKALRNTTAVNPAE